MAASTRFHGSVLPPRTHGMFPSRSWTAAIASTVAATSPRLMMPGTSGSSCRRTGAPSARGADGTVACHGGLDLLDVDDDALAEHRVERPFERRHPSRVVLDHPA